MNPAYKLLIFLGLLDLFYGYPLDFEPTIHPQFFSPIYGIFWQCDNDTEFASLRKLYYSNLQEKLHQRVDSFFKDFQFFVCEIGECFLFLSQGTLVPCVSW